LQQNTQFSARLVWEERISLCAAPDWKMFTLQDTEQLAGQLLPRLCKNAESTAQITERQIYTEKNVAKMKKGSKVPVGLCSRGT
jgi:hypothetical protein